jgi:hypothetical protein
MFIQKRFLLTTEEINAFSTVHNVLEEICENNQCESCILKEYCHTCFDPSSTIHYVKQSIVNGE